MDTETEEQIVTLTPKALSTVEALLAQEEDPEGLNLRIAVAPGGCSGFKYSLNFDEGVEDGDIIHVVNDKVNVVVDSSSAQILKGTVLDYVDGLKGTGFSF